MFLNEISFRPSGLLKMLLLFLLFFFKSRSFIKRKDDSESQLFCYSSNIGSLATTFDHVMCNRIKHLKLKHQSFIDEYMNFLNKWLLTLQRSWVNTRKSSGIASPRIYMHTAGSKWKCRQCTVNAKTITVSF